MSAPAWLRPAVDYGPLAVFFAVYAARDLMSATAALMVATLIGLGAAIAAYHSWLQVSQTTCGLGAISCARIQYRVLGLTVPNLSLVAFLLVTGLVVAASTMRS